MRVTIKANAKDWTATGTNLTMKALYEVCERCIGHDKYQLTLEDGFDEIRTEFGRAMRENMDAFIAGRITYDWFEARRKAITADFLAKETT